MDKIKLLNELANDEGKNNKSLYSSGPYWKQKNIRTINQIKKFGLKDFRGYSSSIGTSYSDSIVHDIRNEFGLKGRIASSVFFLPFLKDVFNSQLELTSEHIKLYIENLSIIYKNNDEVLKLLKKFKFKDTTKFGCLKKFEVDNKEYSVHYLDMAHRVDILSETFDFKEIKSFFEIGGGFGSNIHFLLTNFPNIKKIIYLDIVPNIYVGTQYLKLFYGDAVKDYLVTKNLSKISFAQDNNLEIFCLPPWQIEKLDVDIDHFHNAASFVEMPKKIISNYCKFIDKFNTKEISLISYDKHDPETTFNPELLSDFFKKKLNIRWENTLIKDYKRKLIFLTSK